MTSEFASDIKCKEGHTIGKNAINRRDFLKTCLTATAAVSTFSCKGIFSSKKANPFDPKGLPARALGKTGVKVPPIVVGCGSRFCTVIDPEESFEILTYVLGHGTVGIGSYDDTGYFDDIILKGKILN